MLIYPTIDTLKLRTVSRETNDCTVRAFAAAAQLPYEKAHAIMAKHGRKFGDGTRHDTQVKAYAEAGGKLKAIFGKTNGAKFRAKKAPHVPHEAGITLKTLLDEMPLGRFVCFMRGHAFAIIDRQLADGAPLPAGTRITAIYRFD